MTNSPAPDAAVRLDFALDAARRAGGLTLEHFRAGVSVETKRDGSEVSIADRRAESFLREAIARAFPRDAVLGEEHDDTPGDSGWRWILDPIDGTFSFVRGVPLYATLIAAERVDSSGRPGDGSAEVGVIDLPGLGETVYAARGGGAWHRTGDGPARPASVSRAAALNAAHVSTTSIDYFRTPAHRAAHARVLDASGHVRGWPDAYAFALVATGRCDAVFEPAVKAWDCGPVLPIVEEAGGRVTCWRGERSVHAGTLLATNGAVHDELLGLLRG